MITVYVYDGITKVVATSFWGSTGNGNILETLKITSENVYDYEEMIEEIDNGSLISTGLHIFRNNMPILKKILDKYGAKLEKIDLQTANHSSCQSRCMLRGDPICQW